jgi:hypothetical protein
MQPTDCSIGIRRRGSGWVCISRRKSKATATSKTPAAKAGGHYKVKSIIKGAQLKLAATNSKATSKSKARHGCVATEGRTGRETNATQLLDTTRMPILAFATPDSHNCVVSAVRASQFMNSRLLKASLQCATVVLLLFAVAGLSTLAKNSQYFSKSNPAHYVNIATKMTESHLPAIINRTPQLPVARFVPPQPEMQITQVVRAEIPALPSIGVTVSLQHRSPPISLS